MKDQEEKVINDHIDLINVQLTQLNQLIQLNKLNKLNKIEPTELGDSTELKLTEPKEPV